MTRVKLEALSPRVPSTSTRAPTLRAVMEFRVLRTVDLEAMLECRVPCAVSQESDRAATSMLASWVVATPSKGLQVSWATTSTLAEWVVANPSKGRQEHRTRVHLWVQRKLSRMHRRRART
mmetsp:Transcript_118185/g.329604  ORF Transcript_118185/g.329604 Transcript_118185/m.329604 type:complete len:121 (-) Transcript_118185:159-521(-)